MQNRLYPEAQIIGTRRSFRLASPSRTVTSRLLEKSDRPILVAAFFVAHFLLAILISRNSNLATVHALLTFSGALWFVFGSDKIERVAYAAAYITGAEVLWRMTDAYLPWEIGKYAVAAIFISAMLRFRRTTPPLLPILYFALLLPSVFLTFQNSSLTQARSLLSSNLSGPFCLMVAGCFFSQLSLTRKDLLRMFLLLIGPVIGVATLAAAGISSLDNIVFTNESNFDASGGFGPNQVSSILGAGALAAFLVLLDRDTHLNVKFLVLAIMLFLSVQAALTFSRGGLYNLVGAIALASIFLLKDSRTRIQFVLAVVLICSLSYFVILPRLDSFTNSAFSARFEDFEATGREEIVQMDLEIWLDHPILGVGPGMAKDIRAELGREASAHTEFSRLLSEHGLFGLAALFCFLLAAALNVLKARTTRERALIVAISGWSFLYMLNAATRLVAPSLMLGLAFVSFIPGREQTLAYIRQNGGKTIPRLRLPVFSREVSRSQSS